jgi:translocation and assembly module TamB
VDMSVLGPVDDLNIDLKITSLKGTDLFVQLLPDVNTIRPPYINFVGEEEEADRLFLPGDTAEKVRRAQADFAQFNFKSIITLNPEAVFNIIIDPANGDMITARGRGDISLNMDSEENINLFGNYVIEEGNYDLKFLGVIKRTFSVQSGSSISWSGDPESPLLDITAIYETRAPRIDLVSDMTDIMTPEEIRAARRSLPVHVLMNMRGELTEPTLEFDIEVPEATAAADAGVVNQRIEQIKNDPTELNKQAFGLIVLGRFIYDGIGFADTGGESPLLGQAGQSVSRLLNRQLENVSDQYLGGIELEVNIEALDQREGTFAQNVELMASRQISDRITVTAGGTVNVGTPERSTQFAGDYAIHYRLNDAGTVSLRFFRTGQHDIFTDNVLTKNGASINHHKDFNRLRDLWPW